MRKTLPALLALGGLACIGGAIAPAATQAQVTTTPVKHVIVIYMENHSFDNLLGFWCDAHPGRCPDGGMPASVRLSDGAVVRPSVAPDTVPNVQHSVQAQQAAIDGGRMDGWASIPGGSCSARAGYRCITGYQPAQIPNLTALAGHFAISDRTFSVADSPSWEGHMAMVAASTDQFYGDNPSRAPGVRPGPGWGCDSNKVTTWVAPGGTLRSVPSCVPAKRHNLRFGGAFRRTPVSTLPTIMDRLDAARLSWRIYGAIRGAKGYGVWDICPTFAGCLDTGQDANLVPDGRFMSDARAGRLPSFSVVTPGGSDFLSGCHNEMSITACDNWIGQLVGAVEKSPDWSSSVVFITFDDCGCFYDQVAPPTEPDGSQDGLRVPLLIVSPYVRPGYTDTSTTTYAGILAYTEHTFGLSPLGINDAGAYDFSRAFSYAQAPASRVRMVLRPLPASARGIRLTPALASDPT